MTTMLEAIRWDGSNVAEVERFLDRPTAIVGDVLHVPDPRSGESLTVPLGGWLVRAEGQVHVLGAAVPRASRAEMPAERVEELSDALAFESGFD